MSIVKICKTNTLVTKAQHKRYHPRRKKTPCLFSFQHHMMSICIPLSRLKIFCCEVRSGCHSTCNSDSQLSVDSYRGSEILPPGTGTALNKNNMSSDQEFCHNPNQALSLKPKNAITDITKLKISLKSGYVHLSSN